MNKSVFNFLEYKAYLRHLVGQFRERKGMRTQLAEAIGAQPAFISHVLNGEAQLSFEQAHATNQFFGHSDDESDFFLLLLHLDRAGTTSLRKYWRAKISALLEKRQILVERLGKDSALSLTDQNIYYSSWMFAALHMASSVETMQTAATMAEQFRIPIFKVSEVLEDLVRMGLVEQAGRTFRMSKNRIRVGRDSHNVIRHHANWRAQAVKSAEMNIASDLHYSGCYSLSQTDFQRIKDNLLDHLKSQLEIVDASKEEKVVCLNLDFFQV